MDDAEKKQIELNKSYEHLSTVKNFSNFCESRQGVINVFTYYYKMTNNALYDGKYGEALKILTPKQMFQRFNSNFCKCKSR